MHELSIAMALVEQIEAVAERHQLPHITDVELETGALRQVVPEIMQLAFQEATHGTLSEGARLTVREIPARAQCDHCSTTFEPRPHDFLCPRCDSTQVTVTQGDGIILKSVVCQPVGSNREVPVGGIPHEDKCC